MVPIGIAIISMLYLSPSSLSPSYPPLPPQCFHTQFSFSSSFYSPSCLSFPFKWKSWLYLGEFKGNQSVSCFMSVQGNFSYYEVVSCQHWNNIFVIFMPQLCVILILMDIQKDVVHHIVIFFFNFQPSIFNSSPKLESVITRDSHFFILYSF